MTKLLTITSLLLTLLVSPLIAKEKILKCDPLKNRYLPSSYYKTKTSFYIFKSYYLRVGENWMPFCKNKGSAISWSSKESQNRQTPLEIIKGENAIACVYQISSTDTNEISHYKKVRIDFDLNSSTYCESSTITPLIRSFTKDRYDNSISFSCPIYYKNNKCEVIE